MEAWCVAHTKVIRYWWGSWWVVAFGSTAHWKGGGDVNSDSTARNSTEPSGPMLLVLLLYMLTPSKKLTLYLDSDEVNMLLQTQHMTSWVQREFKMWMMSLRKCMMEKCLLTGLTLLSKNIALGALYVIIGREEEEEVSSTADQLSSSMTH